MGKSKFSQSEVRYLDTKCSGAVTIRGIPLEADEEGFVEGPPDLWKDIEPHGFVREDKLTEADVARRAESLKAHQEFLAKQAQKAQAKPGTLGLGKR